MKLAVLEWLCGGGMADVPQAEISSSMRSEGAAMLGCLVDMFRACGCEVQTALDSRMLASTLSQLDCEALVADTCRGAWAPLPAVWLEVAAGADLTIVVAPEIDGILQTCVERLSSAGIQLLNCSGAFLDAACDKLVTAELLIRSHVAHPTTYRLDRFQELGRQRPAGRWIAKPRFGAGSTQLRVFQTPRGGGSKADNNVWQQDDAHSDDRQKVLLQKDTMQKDIVQEDIVQAYVDGQAFSCSAIVDRSGARHWMPLVTQEFAPDFTYLGGRLAPMEMQRRRPLELLNRTLSALGAGTSETGAPCVASGWIGVDLLYRAAEEDWLVIEVNPRCTTSMLGLHASCPIPLGKLWLSDGSSPLTALPAIKDWQLISFQADGSCYTIQDLHPHP